MAKGMSTEDLKKELNEFTKRALAAHASGTSTIAVGLLTYALPGTQDTKNAYWTNLDKTRLVWYLRKMLDMLEDRETTYREPH